MFNPRANESGKYHRQDDHHQQGMQQGPQKSQHAPLVAHVQLLERQCPNEFPVLISLTYELQHSEVLTAFQAGII